MSLRARVGRLEHRARTQTPRLVLLRTTGRSDDDVAGLQVFGGELFERQADESVDRLVERVEARLDGTLIAYAVYR